MKITKYLSLDQVRRSKFDLMLLIALAFATGSTTPAADARIIRLEILSVQSPTFGGLAFGSVGPYEKIFARAYGEVDPSDRRNSLITDIDLAPRNSSGMVEYSADVHIIKPVDLSKGNQRIFYDVVNRGNKGHGAFNEVGGNNPTTAADAGTGLLMRRGYTLVFSGWEDEGLVPPGNNRALARLPIAPQPRWQLGCGAYDHGGHLRQCQRNRPGIDLSRG